MTTRICTGQICFFTGTHEEQHSADESQPAASDAACHLTAGPVRYVVCLDIPSTPTGETTSLRHQTLHAPCCCLRAFRCFSQKASLLAVGSSDVQRRENFGF